MAGVVRAGDMPSDGRIDSVCCQCGEFVCLCLVDVGGWVWVAVCVGIGSRVWMGLDGCEWMCGWVWMGVSGCVGLDVWVGLDGWLGVWVGLDG